MGTAPTTDSDRAAILQVHKDWWESNNGIDVPRMRTCFPSGPNFLMFNSNGHPYFGIDEIDHLWSHYKGQITVSEAKVKIVDLRVSGDAAWLACEGTTRVAVVGSLGTGADMISVGADEGLVMRFRATEVYERNDGDGNAEWRMWHFHGSPTAPELEPRPSYNDTAAERGLGGNPWAEPFEVVES